MIFTPEHVELIKQGKKTMTRRAVKPGETYCAYPEIVEDIGGRLKWRVGHTYAIQPGRTKPGIPDGRIRITAIRRERVGDIMLSRDDMRAELGIETDIHATWELTRAFHVVWDSINKRPGTRWADNPEVWVLEFEFVPTEEKP